MNQPVQPIADDTKYRQELSQGRFIALLFVQFFTAFNDNLFRWLVIPIGQNFFGDVRAITIGTVLFTLPFLLFAPLAGFFADKFAKRKVIIAFKFLEIVVMLLGVLAIWLDDQYLLMGLIFVMGTQSALFSPAKFGAIPEMLSVKALSEGNGLMAMVTIVACAIGTFCGLNLYAGTFENEALVTIWPIAASLLGIAVLGWISSLFVKTAPAADPQRKMNANPVTELRPSLQQLFKDPPLAGAAVGIASFYFLASLFQINIDAFGEHTLLLNKANISYLMASLVVGIGLGSLFAGWVSGGTIQLGIVPIGAMGIAFTSMVLGIIGWNVDQASVESINFGYNSSLIWLFLLGAIGSLFYIPLESYLQDRSPINIRGSILSAANALTNAFILLSAGLFGLLVEFFLFEPPTVFFIAGVISLLLVIAAFACCAARFIAFVQRTIMNLLYSVHLHGFDKIPKEGGALLVPNHISWMDGPMLCSFAPRAVRFMVYAQYTRLWFIQWASDISRVIPLSPREGPKAIMGALKEARKSAQSGELVCIFPEGGISRTGRLMTFNKGVLKIVQGTDVPVYPIYIHGMWGSKMSYRNGLFKSPFKWRRRVDIYVGDAHYDVKSPGQLHRAVEEIAANSMRDQMLKEPIPARQFVKQCRSSLFRRKVADSSGAELTGGKLLAGSLAFKKVLERDVYPRAGERIGVLLPPSVGGVLANTALALSDKVSVNLNYTLDDAVMNHCIKDAEIKCVLTSRKFIEKKPVQLDAELIYLEDLKESVTGGDRTKSALKTFLLPAYIQERLLGLHKIDRHDCLTIIYTSGSTGEPKGVMLSHHNVLSNVGAVNYMFSLKEEDTLLGVLPFFHSFGYTISMWLVLATPPCGVYHFNPLDARQIGKLAEKYKGTIILATPTFLRTYLKRITPEQFQHLWLIVVGAEKLPENLANQCEEKYGVTPIEGYGSTEMSPLVAANQPNMREDTNGITNNRLGTVGQCVPGVFPKVVDPDTHAERELNEEGLLMVTGENVMLGYLNKPDKTAEVIEDGWYNTGDIARIDADGFITLTGRQSRFSKIGGEMVPHIRVEEILNSILDALDPVPEDESDDSPAALLRLAITAVPDEKKGERLIVVHKPLNCSREDFRQQIKEADLPNLWMPGSDGYLEVAEIPLLGTGKLDLKGLKDLVLEKFASDNR